MKKLTLLFLSPFLLVLIVVVLKWNLLQSASYLIHPDGTREAKFVFKRGSEGEPNVIKPGRSVREVSGKVTIMSQDAGVPLPDITPLKGSEYLDDEIKREGPSKVVLPFKRLPQSGFFFEFNRQQPQPEEIEIKVVDLEGNETVVYKGPPFPERKMGVDEAVAA